MTLEEAWKEMESLVKEGLVRLIGISNFKPEHIERLAKVWTIKPSVHQVRQLRTLILMVQNGPR